jgi:hypothetical protein
MSFIEAKDGAQLHVKDTGKGRPVVLIHGCRSPATCSNIKAWPFSKPAIELSPMTVAALGNRVTQRQATTTIHSPTISPKFSTSWTSSQQPGERRALELDVILAVMASPKATIACVDAFGKTDFRNRPMQ